MVDLGCGSGNTILLATGSDLSPRTLSQTSDGNMSSCLVFKSVRYEKLHVCLGVVFVH